MKREGAERNSFHEMWFENWGRMKANGPHWITMRAHGQNLIWINVTVIQVNCVLLKANSKLNAAMQYWKFQEVGALSVLNNFIHCAC